MLFEKITQADFDFPDPEWTDVSEEAKNFIRKMIVKDPVHRYTAIEALEDPWLLRGKKKSAANELHKDFKDMMNNYNTKRKQPNVQN
jgi:serine/threonine protein kinase